MLKLKRIYSLYNYFFCCYIFFLSSFFNSIYRILWFYRIYSRNFTCLIHSFSYSMCQVVHFPFFFIRFLGLFFVFFDTFIFKTLFSFLVLSKISLISHYLISYRFKDIFRCSMYLFYESLPCLFKRMYKMLIYFLAHRNNCNF